MSFSLEKMFDPSGVLMLIGCYIFYKQTTLAGVELNLTKRH